MYAWKIFGKFLMFLLAISSPMLSDFSDFYFIFPISLFQFTLPNLTTYTIYEIKVCAASHSIIASNRIIHGKCSEPRKVIALFLSLPFVMWQFYGFIASSTNQIWENSFFLNSIWNGSAARKKNISFQFPVVFVLTVEYL